MLKLTVHVQILLMFSLCFAGALSAASAWDKICNRTLMGASLGNYGAPEYLLGEVKFVGRDDSWIKVNRGGYRRASGSSPLGLMDIGATSDFVDISLKYFSGKQLSKADITTIQSQHPSVQITEGSDGVHVSYRRNDTSLDRKTWQENARKLVHFFSFYQ
jgi:hypothetical protein